MNTEILEGNKLIAEFMGFEYNRSLPGHGGTTLLTLTLKDCRYHSSWDWLMPVVEKIEKEDVSFVIEGCNSYWYKNGEIMKGKGRFSDSKIKSVWLAVVLFIKWYNKNKN